MSYSLTYCERTGRPELFPVPEGKSELTIVHQAESEGWVMLNGERREVVDVHRTKRGIQLQLA